MTRAKPVIVLTSVNTGSKLNWQPETTSLPRAVLKLEASKVGERRVGEARVEEDAQIDVYLFLGLDVPVK